jgi:hypothetical protein
MGRASKCRARRFHLSFETTWYRVEADRELAEEAGGFPLDCRQEQATRTLA